MTSLTSSLQQKLFGRSNPPQSAQQSLPYREMYRDGICRVDGRLYTKTLSFSDITYQLAQNEDKSLIFGAYCDFLNRFDPSISLQLTCINRRAKADEFRLSIPLTDKQDAFTSIRSEHAEMLRNQWSRGNNGIVKGKYLIFGVEAASLSEAKLRLERIEADIIIGFKAFGVIATPLSGLERLGILYDQLHPDNTGSLSFRWKDVVDTGLSTKDAITPMSFNFSDSRHFRIEKHYGSVSFIQILASELSDRILADLLDLNTAITVNLHIRSIDQTQAIKAVKSKLSDLDKMRIDSQQNAVRSGYDMDILPPDLVTYGKEAQNLLTELQNRNERMFMVTVLVQNTAATKKALDNDLFAAAGVVQKHNCALKPLEYQQEQGLMSSLILGRNEIDIQHGLTTSAVAVFVPFTTAELFQGGDSFYYGLNGLSHNLVMADRKSLKNPNGLYCQGRFS